MTIQVNRQRLSTAAAHIPRQPRFLAHGQCRWPATHPPGMPCGPWIDDCFSIISENGENLPGIQTTVKVYPPMVRGHHFQHLLLIIYF
jgi:hypothetical protein